MDFVDAFIPICVSCVMPISIVGLFAWANARKSAHKMNVMIKAIENGAEVDPNVLMSVRSRTISTKMQLVRRLGAGVTFTLVGLMFILSAVFGLTSFPVWGYYPGFPLLAIGAGFLVSFFFGRSFLKSQMESEEK